MVERIRHWIEPLEVRFRRWVGWWRRPEEPISLVVMSKGHVDVQKIHLSPKLIKGLKWGFVSTLSMVVVSALFFVKFLLDWPEKTLMEQENLALRQELNQVQFHLDNIQTQMDRVGRFDQKLRALTEIDKEFAKMRGPKGQGGGEMVADAGNEVFDLGEQKIDARALQLSDDSEQVLDRRQVFLLQKIYTWMQRLYKSSELQGQSIEELYEVLKGREIQLAATPSILPVQGWVTSQFGYRIDPFTQQRALHRGLDVAARKGAPIVGPAAGSVTFAGRYGSYGNSVMIFHGYGVSSLYAHMDEIFVQQGQKVRRGDVIGTVGTTGRSTAAHLHYEVIVHGVPVDPRQFVLDRRL